MRRRGSWKRGSEAEEGILKPQRQELAIETWLVTRHLSLFLCHLSPVTCSLLLRRFPLQGVDFLRAGVAQD